MDKIKTILLHFAYWQKIAEIAVLFFLLPLLIVLDVIVLPLWLILIIMGFSAILFLNYDNSFDKKNHINLVAAKKYFIRMLLFFFLAALVMVAIIYLLDPSKLFIFPREEPQLLVIMSVVYPLFSVIPQELAYRTFFFHRYGELFSSKWGLIFASALFFSFGHIHYKSPLVMLLTFVAGFIFAYRYHQSKSLTLTVIEHTLYGMWLFASGLGVYFVSSIA